jgi:hypothetical protein
MRNERNASIVINHRVMHAICACAVVLFSVLPASAQVYSTYQSSSAVVESDLQYQSYQSTVYAPFDNTMPSENTSLYQSPSNSDAGDRSNAPSNRRNLGGVGDPGNQSQESPVGEAWVMLFFAAVAALVVFVRQRRAAELQA